MGNSQSADRAIRRRNRLSKPPSSIPTKPAPSPKCRNLVDTTPYSYQSPWLGSTLDDSPALQQPPSGRNVSSQFTSDSFHPNESLGEEDFDITPEKDSPMKLATRADELRRRLSAPGTAVKANRFSLNLTSAQEDMSDIQTTLPNRRATIQDANELVSGLGLSFDEPFENKENKPYFRRHSLRIPGIATRVPENSPLPTDSPEDGNYDHACCCERKTSPGPSLLGVDFPTHNRPRGLSPLRASTPNDFEYSYLGGLRPGSLHIVNGCASPTPSSFEPGSLCEKSAYGGPCDGPRSMSLHANCQKSSDLQGSPSSVPQDAIGTVESQVNIDSLDAKSYEIANEEPAQCTYPDFVPDAQAVSLVRDAASGPDDGPPPDLRAFEKSPNLLVTSKSTALEDDLFEDEAVDILMPQRESCREEETFSGGSKGFASCTPKTGSSPDYAGQIQKRNSNKLSKSDSGYSSASSKEPSQSYGGYLCRNGSRSDVSYGRRYNDVDDSTNRYQNSQPSGSSIPVYSTIRERESAESAEITEAGPISTDFYNSPGLGATSSEYHSHENNSSGQRYYRNIEAPTISQEYPENPVEENKWTTYQPKLWPLRNDRTTPDEQYSSSRQFFQVMPHLNKPDILHVSSPTLPATAADPSQAVQPRNSSPTQPQRPNSTGTIADLSERPPSDKYINRIKSLVTLRGQQQQRSGRRTTLRTSLPANLKQAQEQETSNEKRRRTNKLRRKSLMF